MTGILTRNLGWKAASVGVAFLLWMTMSGSRETTMSIAVPVQYRNVPNHIEISSQMIEQIHLILRGPSVRLSRLSSAELPVIVDLSKVSGTGETTFTVGTDNVALPAGVALERSIPSQIRLRLETRISRQVPIRLRYVQVPPGMMVANHEVDPSTVTIVGPESRVAKIEFVETDPVDLRTLDDNGEARTMAYAGDPQVVFTSSAAVKVRVVVQRIESAEPVKK